MTQTPASGPLLLVTTPVITPVLSAAATFVWVLHVSPMRVPANSKPTARNSSVLFINSSSEWSLVMRARIFNTAYYYITPVGGRQENAENCAGEQTGELLRGDQRSQPAGRPGCTPERRLLDLASTAKAV